MGVSRKEGVMTWCVKTLHRPKMAAINSEEGSPDFYTVEQLQVANIEVSPKVREELLKPFKQRLLRAGTCKRADKEGYDNYRHSAASSAPSSNKHLSHEIEHDTQCYVDAMLSSSVSDYTGMVQYLATEEKTTTNANLLTYMFPRSTERFHVRGSLGDVDLLHEAIIGFHVGNRMRVLTPSFGYTYAYLSCGAGKDAGTSLDQYCHYMSGDVTHIIKEEVVGNTFQHEENGSYADYIILLLQLFSALSVANALYNFEYHGGLRTILVVTLEDAILVPIYRVVRGLLGFPATDIPQPEPNVIGYVSTRKIPIFTDYSMVSADVKTDIGIVPMKSRGQSPLRSGEVANILPFARSRVEGGRSAAVQGLLSWIFDQGVEALPSLLVEKLLTSFRSQERELVPNVVAYGRTRRTIYFTLVTPDMSTYADIVLAILLLQYADDNFSRNGPLADIKDLMKKQVSPLMVREDMEKHAKIYISQYKLSSTEELDKEVVDNEFPTAKRRKPSIYYLAIMVNHIYAAVMGRVKSNITTRDLSVASLRSIVLGFVIAYGRVKRFVDVANGMLSTYPNILDRDLHDTYITWRNVYTNYIKDRQGFASEIDAMLHRSAKYVDEKEVADTIASYINGWGTSQ